MNNCEVMIQKDELIRLFELIQARPGMFCSRGTEFWVTVGRVYGMIEAGVEQLRGFQSWVSQELSGWPSSPIVWEVIIAHSVTGEYNRLPSTDEERLAAFHLTLSLLISYCRSLPEKPGPESVA